MFINKSSFEDIISENYNLHVEKALLGKEIEKLKKSDVNSLQDAINLFIKFDFGYHVRIIERLGLVSLKINCFMTEGELQELNVINYGLNVKGIDSNNNTINMFSIPISQYRDAFLESEIDLQRRNNLFNLTKGVASFIKSEFEMALSCFGILNVQIDIIESPLSNLLKKEVLVSKK